MQKFGLETVLEKAHRFDKFRNLEIDLLKEQSSALGRAGRKLKESIEIYEKEKIKGYLQNSEEEYLQQIGNNLYSLMIQREMIGFIDSNVDWIKQFYEIPEGAFQYEGVYRAKR